MPGVTGGEPYGRERFVEHSEWREKKRENSEALELDLSGLYGLDEPPESEVEKSSDNEGDGGNVMSREEMQKMAEEMRKMAWEKAPETARDPVMKGDVGEPKLMDPDDLDIPHLREVGKSSAPQSPSASSLNESTRPTNQETDAPTEPREVSLQEQDAGSVIDVLDRALKHAREATDGDSDAWGEADKWMKLAVAKLRLTDPTQEELAAIQERREKIMELAGGTA